MEYCPKIPASEPQIELIAANSKKEMGEFFADYRTTTGSLPDINDIRTDISMLSNHYTQGGAKGLSYPVPQDLKERLVGDFSEIRKALDGVESGQIERVSKGNNIATTSRLGLSSLSGN